MTVNNIPCTYFIPAPKEMNQIEIQLLVQWAEENKINIGWQQGQKAYYYGSEEFMDAVNNYPPVDPFAEENNETKL